MQQRQQKKIIWFIGKNLLPSILQYLYNGPKYLCAINPYVFLFHLFYFLHFFIRVLNFDCETELKTKMLI